MRAFVESSGGDISRYNSQRAVGAQNSILRSNYEWSPQNNSEKIVQVRQFLSKIRTEK